MQAEKLKENILPSPEALKDWLRPIEDPEMLLSLVELGLIYECVITETPPGVRVKMTLTTPSCPAAGYIVEQVRSRILEHPGVRATGAEAQVELVFEPRWDPHTMASEDCKERLGLW